MFDVVVIGAGPAGLTTAINGAAEGLKVMVVEAERVGGRAATSHLIENFPGFPNGVDGEELTRRMHDQAVRLGAQFTTGRVTNVVRLGSTIVVYLGHGQLIFARSVVLALGLSWKQWGVIGAEQFYGRGVWHGASREQLPRISGKEIVIIGGGNAAAQASCMYSRVARSVTMLVRGDSLARSTAAYLVDKLKSCPNVRVATLCSVERVSGNARRKLLRIRTPEGISCLLADDVFAFIGSEPRTEWLPQEIARNAEGFIITGEGDALPYETGLRGVFAVGDVRATATWGVAGSVGEGVGVIPFLHQHLQRSWDCPSPRRATERQRARVQSRGKWRGRHSI